MIPSDDLIRLFRLRATMALVIILTGIVAAIVCIVHLVLTRDVIPFLALVAMGFVCAPTTRRLLDPSRIGLPR